MARNATYYPGDLRRALLDAALEAVASEGPSAVSLRALARSVGVSHAAPANHFADKRALFTAIAVEGFDGLLRNFEAAFTDLGDDPDPIASLVAAGRGYARFAFEHPSHFAVMWRDDLLDPDDTTLGAAGDATLHVLVEGVRAAQANAGLAPGEDADDVAALLWASVHGVVVLWQQGPLATEHPDRDGTAMIDAVAGVLVRALTGP